MFTIKSNEIFYLNQIVLLLEQKGIPINNKNQNINLILIHVSDNKLKISFNQYNELLSLPLSFHFFFNKLINIISDIKIIFDGLEYYPLKQNLLFKNHRVQLRDTHNIIFKEVLNREKYSIDKEKLYKKIWPNDAETQMNKLDTHLTNLKTLLNDQINYNLKFKTINGKLLFIG